MQPKTIVQKSMIQRSILDKTDHDKKVKIKKLYKNEKYLMLQLNIIDAIFTSKEINNSIRSNIEKRLKDVRRQILMYK